MKYKIKATRRRLFELAICTLVLLALATWINCGKDSTTSPEPPKPPSTPVATRVEIAPSSATLSFIGQTIQLTARVFDQNSAVMTAATVNWSSSLSGVATVAAQGLVTAVNNGTAIVTARSGNASASVTVTVMQSVASIVVEPATASLMSIGETVQLTAAVLDENGQPVANAVVAWQSGNQSVVTVAAQGLVTAVNNGTAIVTARSGNASASVTVTVMQSVASIVVEPATASLMSIGETVQLTAAVLDENGQPVANAVVAWQSGNQSVVTVAAQGLVTAVNNGTAIVTARSGNASASVTVTVMQSVASIVVEPATASLMSIGETVQLTAAVLDENGQPVANAVVAWQSGNQSVVTVAAQGLVTAVNNGEATITASAGEGEGSATITVVELAGLEVYLTQATQSLVHPVPLVAGKKALLRVFVTAAHVTTVGIPPVRAKFFLNGTERHVADIPATTVPIPMEVVEGDLFYSANAEVPAEIIQPGLELVIELDPERTPVSVARRIPETGRMAVEVHSMPTFDLTLIPFVWSETGDLSIVDLITAMATDPDNHEMLRNVVTLLPVGDLAVMAHEPVLSTTNDSYALISQTVAIRAMEGGIGHYLGMMLYRYSDPPGSITGPQGLARRSDRAAFSVPHSFVIGHEIGHTFELDHAACGTTIGGLDPLYPYPFGSIGAWGFDFLDGGRLVPPNYTDLMGYCNTRFWISDYHFTKALRFRLSDERSPQQTARSLLLWGGIDLDGVPFLEPAFFVDAPAELPVSAGEYRVTGRTFSGRELFSLSFGMPGTADGDGSSSFAFILPVQSWWEVDLASIMLSGPGGSFALDSESDLPMVILRNPWTGQVRGILRDLSPLTRTARDVGGDITGPDLEVLFSRGIPAAAAQRQ